MVLITYLSKDRLKEIYGGEITLAAGCLIVAGIVFVIGVIDGFLRPLQCRK